MSSIPSPEAFHTVRLTADLSGLSENERRMLPLLFEAAAEMDAIFWQQAYGNPEVLLDHLDDPARKRLIEIHYGPWDRLNGNRPLLPGVGAKPPGASFYPLGVTKDDLEAAAKDDPALLDTYTIVRRDGDGGFQAVPYHEVYAERMQRAAAKLRAAADLAEDDGLRRYLDLRAEALLTGDYRPSDLAWMDMKTNTIDVIIGPIETYEDQLMGCKAACEAFILIKDHAWSERLARYVDALPMLQQSLPVPDAYKAETPSTGSDLYVYDAICYAGDTNAGAKSIAINLPNDGEVILQKGARSLQLKNTMRAKFDAILRPIADLLIVPDQRPHVTFDAFFGNVLFHEIAHGLGIKKTVADGTPVRAALRDAYTTIEEGKADILGLYMVTKLHDEGQWAHDRMDHFVTFLASIFRSIRFGTASAHGRANLMRFNVLREHGAVERIGDGTYRVHPEAMETAMTVLAERILRLQGDGDYDGAQAFITEYGSMPSELELDLARLNSAAIPVDVVFEQGLEVLGLERKA